MLRILIASPVRQKPAILREFLAGLEGLETEGLEIEFTFIDDNDNEESSRMLRGLNLPGRLSLNPNLSFAMDLSFDRPEYACTEDTHHWNDSLVSRLSAYKDCFIRLARNRRFDYLFLVDSDLILHPKTLTHLLSLGKDIVSEVFWTRWTPEKPPLPNAWVSGPYHMHRHLQGMPNGDMDRQDREFLTMLRTPGTYPVGGLGACTLISRRALEAGVSFAAIDNLDYWGEDRAFCIRARVLGLDLWADTHYPPYHIYRESELPGLALWRDRQRERGSRITVGMLVRNEAGRYLEQVLEQVKQFADNIVIIDDASTDATTRKCMSLLWIGHRSQRKWSDNSSLRYYSDDKSRILIANREDKFANEVELRRQLWNECITMQSDWLIILDADELLEPRALEEIRRLATDPEAEAYSFRLFDMWDTDHYRDDALWSAHKRPWPLMVRYIPGREYVWREQPLHCGRFPKNALDGLVVKDSGLRIKHMGWATEKDRQEKAERYAHLDPEAKYGIKEQYDSILDPSPTLRPWIDEEKPPTISLCMIVKDEERNLPRCLESVRGVVDEMIVVNTGSKDRTSEIALDAGATVVEFFWQDDFSHPRNVSLYHATGDWILILDADEELPPATRDALRALVNNAPPEVEGYFCTIDSIMDDGHQQDVVFRLFRNRPEYRFEGAIHEQITESILRHQGRNCLGRADELVILHHGFTRQEIERKQKALRNLEMMEADPPADGEQLRLYQYGIELQNAGRWDDAIAAFVRATRGIHPGQIFLPKLIRGLIICLVNAGKPERALALVRLGVRMWPDYADLWYWAGVIERDRGNLLDAYMSFDEAIDHEKQPPQYSSVVTPYMSVYQKGLINEAWGRIENAEGNFEAALHWKPDFAEAADALKRLQSRQGTNPADLSDWDLMHLLLGVVQSDEALDIITADGRDFRGVSAESVGWVIEGRGE